MVRIRGFVPRISTTFCVTALTCPIWGSTKSSTGRCPIEGVRDRCQPAPSARNREHMSEEAGVPIVGAQGPRFAPDTGRTEQGRRLTFIGKCTMSDLQEISRVVYRHDWTSVDQWASTLDQLADLTDDQIAELEHLVPEPSSVISPAS